ncbi:MAG: FTR1 family protein, partial [bacterium]
GRREEALAEAASAYLDGFERIEKDLAARTPGLVASLENEFGVLRERIAAGAPLGDVLGRLEAGLRRAGSEALAPVSGAAALGQSFVIIVREGFEVILVLAALSTYLIRVGQRDKTTLLYGGAGAAVAASFGLAWVAGRLLTISPASQELIEGLSQLLAAAVLFWMSHWILSLTLAGRWNAYIQRKAQVAARTGSHLTLAGVGFLVVFREGVETVLFYNGLAFGAPGQGHLIWIGFGLGTIALLLVSIAMYQLGLRLPLRPFFFVTSALLFAMVFSFTGHGIRELQAGGFLPAHGGSWLPSLPMAGIFPTWEGLLPQLALLLVA